MRDTPTVTDESPFIDILHINVVDVVGVKIICIDLSVDTLSVHVLSIAS